MRGVPVPSGWGPESRRAGTDAMRGMPPRTRPSSPPRMRRPRSSEEVDSGRAPDWELSLEGSGASRLAADFIGEALGVRERLPFDYTAKTFGICTVLGETGVTRRTWRGGSSPDLEG